MSKKKAKKKVVKKAAAKRSRDDVDEVMDSINKLLGDGGSIKRGADIDYLTWERMSSGSLGLDIILGGGLIRGGVVQFKGEESSAKTTMAFQACAAAQARGERVAWGAIEGFDKHWARVNGCYIPYSTKELDNIVRLERLPNMEAAEKMADEYDEAHEGYGEFILITHKSSPMVLEAVSRMVRSGHCSLVVVDSLGQILSETDDEKDIGDPTKVGGAAPIITHFANKVKSGLNSGFNSVDEDGKPTPNRTCVIAINQVRAVIGGYSPRGAPPPEAPGGHGLKHLKDIDVRFTKGELISMPGKGEERNVYYGRVVKAKTDKNKTATPYRAASWTLYFKDVANLGIEAGTIDVPDEVFRAGCYYGLIEQAGAWYIVNQQRFQGRAGVMAYLNANADVVDALYDEIVELVSRGAE